MSTAEEHIMDLKREKNILDPYEFQHARRLLDKEIHQVRTENNLNSPFEENIQQQQQDDLYVEEEEVQLSEKVFLPTENHPHFNIVGKIIGPAGMTLV